nr:unnamed protein product [Spirometra erinaceieuropaei]
MRLLVSTTADALVASIQPAAPPPSRLTRIHDPEIRDYTVQTVGADRVVSDPRKLHLLATAKELHDDAAAELCSATQP